MSKEVDDLTALVYILFGVSFILILLLIIDTVFLHWKVYKLDKRNGNNGQRESENSRELGLQLVNDRFQIPKPNLKKPWDRFEENNGPRNKFCSDNRSFDHNPDERRPNTNGVLHNGFRNQFPGHNDIDTISDSNFSFGMPSNKLRSEPRSNRDQENRRPNTTMQDNDSGFSFPGQNDDHFSFPSQSGAKNDLRNKRDQQEPKPFSGNLRSANSFRNPLSDQNDYDASNDNVPHSQQRNLHRSVNY